MLAFIYKVTFVLSAAASGGEGGGFAHFYNQYFNIPGFELWKFINLALFIGIMTYLVRKPLSEAFKAKREQIRAELILAEEQKNAALARLSDVESRMLSLGSEKEAIIHNAKAEAAAEKARLIEQTNLEIERLRKQKQSDIDRLEKQALAGLRRFSAEESIRLAEEKLRSRVGTTEDARLVKASIQEIGGLN